MLVADREFVGDEWFKWLNDNAIQYHIRIRDNFWVEDPRTNRKIRAQHITMFNGLKSSGFNIEDTHMVHINCIEQLFGVVIIAYTWAYCVGIVANIKVKAVRVLNNGRRAISLVKCAVYHTIVKKHSQRRLNSIENQ